MMTHSSTEIKNTRVIGIFAHIDAGKTTTSEAILYYTGRIHRVGSIDDGTTQLDWMEQERARGITITAAATTCYWREHCVNLIDTPGHIDFTAEVVRSIRAIDGAVIVLCGVGGVETQTETVWRHADRQNLPRLIFVNKLDRHGSNFGRVMDDVRERLTPNAVPLQLPIGDGDTLAGVVDLITQQALIWRDYQCEEWGHVVIGDDEAAALAVPSEMQEQVAEARAALIDAICETDDALFEQHVEGHEPGAAELGAALRRATISGKLTPVLCGSACERIGVQPLLDAIGNYLPSPLDVPPVVGVHPDDVEQIVERPADPTAPLCASAFKIATDPHVGHLTWVRVFSGHLKIREMVYNPRADVRERVGRIYRLHANRREHVDSMRVGDVMALVGVKSAITGDTLCDPAHPIALETFIFPEPVIGVALTPSSDEEYDRLRRSVTRLCQEDPTLHVGFDPETREQILSGMGELHLEIAVDRLRTEFNIVARTSAPQIAYRETVRRRVRATGTYKQQSGGRGHFGVVRVRVEPLERGAGLVFVNGIPPSELSEQFARAAEMGARESLGKGIIAGYPVTDVRVTFTGGKSHAVDSNTMDFQIAGSMAVRKAVRQASPTLLEPVMRADVNVGEDHLGTVIGDLGRRRGSVSGVHVRGQTRNVVGEVPLAEARGYATDLRDFSHGRGTFTLEFCRYDFVPDGVVEQIVKQRRAEGKVPRR